MISEWSAVLAAVFVVLATVHSLLGERVVISPLLAQPWSLGGLSRRAANRLVRFAWHLTSVAWLGLAAIVAGASGIVVAGLIALGSAALVLVMLPGHPAWPVFLIGAFAAGMQTGVLGAAALTALAVVAVMVLLVAAVVHVYWAGGGTRGLAAVLPRTPDGELVVRPPAWVTSGVVVALIALATAMAARLAGVSSAAVTLVIAAGAVVLTLRVIGDGRYAGLTKRVRATRFARNDDRLWTPLTALLAFGAAAALLV